MRSARKSKTALALTGLLPGVLLAWLAIPVGAQPVEGTHSIPSAIRYDAAHEITVTGTLQTIVTKHIAGSPAGMHLLVSGSEGVVDAHVGPFLSRSTQQALHQGVLIQIVGAMENVHGRQVLLARQLVFGGRLVTVRSKSGFLYHGTEGQISPRAQRAGITGGAQ